VEQQPRSFLWYRERQADIIGQSKRSWTLKPAVHVKRPKWMWTSYSIPFARHAKNRDYGLTCREKTSGIRTGVRTSREIPAELCTFELSGIGCFKAPTLSLVE
jgi:hypothetical protein